MPARARDREDRTTAASAWKRIAPAALIAGLAACGAVWVGKCERTPRPAGDARPDPADALRPPGARDWPIFRGDSGLTGVARGALPEDLALRWKAVTGGPVRSSPVIAEGTVFVGSNDGKLRALALEDGAARWEFDAAAGIEAPPLVAGGRVVFGAADGTLHALDARTGSPLWSYRTGDKILGSANAAPAGDGLRIVVGSYDAKVHCVDAATGAPLWTADAKNYVNGAPATSDGVVVFGGCDGRLRFVALTDGHELGSVTAEDESPLAGSPAVAGGRAFVGHYGDGFLCAEIAGARTVWTWAGGGAVFSSPAVTGDRVLFGCRDKRLHCLDRESGRELWSFAARGRVDSSPVVIADRVVFGADDGRLTIVALADGRELWTYATGGAISGAPAVAPPWVVAGSADGGVYAFGPGR